MFIPLFAFMYIAGYFWTFGLIQELGAALLIGVSLLMTARKPSIFLEVVREPPVFVILLFSLAVLLSIFSSIDPHESFRAAKTTVFIRVLVVVLAFNIALKDEEPEKIVSWLLPAFIVCLLGEELINLLQYVEEYLEMGHMNPLGKDHIRFGGPILALLPVAIMGFDHYKNKIVRSLILFLIIASGAMVLMTDSRSAWIGAAAAVGLYGAFLGKRRTIIMASLFVLMAIVSGYFLLPERIVKDSVHRLFELSTSKRAGNGTWGTCIDIIKNSPWLGHGYGREVYLSVNEKLLNSYPDWFWRRPRLPHNLLLESWAFGGVFLFLSTLMMTLSPLFLSFSIALKRLRHETIGRFCLSLCCGCVGLYLVRGLVENPTIDLYGLLMGVGTLAFVKTKNINTQLKSHH